MGQSGGMCPDPCLPLKFADGDWHSPNSLSAQVGGVRNLNFFFSFVLTTNKTWGDLWFGNLVVIVLIAFSVR